MGLNSIHFRSAFNILPNHEKCYFSYRKPCFGAGVYFGRHRHCTLVFDCNFKKIWGNLSVAVISAVGAEMHS